MKSYEQCNLIKFITYYTAYRL